MSEKNVVFSYVIILVIIVITGWLFWVFASNIGDADANVKAGLIGALGMMAAAIFSHHHTKTREINARLFVQKSEAYMKVIDLMFYIIKSIKDEKKLNEREVEKRGFELKKALTIWGHGDVIELWNAYEAIAVQNNDSHMLLSHIEMILRAIRKDLGHDDSLLEFGSVLDLMILVEDKNKITDIR